MFISCDSKILCAEDYYKTDKIATHYLKKFFNNLLRVRNFQLTKCMRKYQGHE